MSFAETLLLSAIAGFTIYLGLPLARRQMGDRARLGLAMFSVGILVFLLIDVLGHGYEDAEAAVEAFGEDEGSFGHAAALSVLLLGGFAVGSVGIAFLGDATSSVTSAAVTSYGRLVGWKLFLGGVRPSSSNVVGHRDVGQSSCPGNALYARLGSIRTAAAAVYDDLVGPGRFSGRAETVSGTFTPLAGDFDGNAHDDVL